MAEKQCFWCAITVEEKDVEGEGFVRLGVGHWFCSMACLSSWEEHLELKGRAHENYSEEEFGIYPPTQD